MNGLGGGWTRQHRIVYWEILRDIESYQPLTHTVCRSVHSVSTDSLRGGWGGWCYKTASLCADKWLSVAPYSSVGVFVGDMSYSQSRQACITLVEHHPIVLACCIHHPQQCVVSFYLYQPVSLRWNAKYPATFRNVFYFTSPHIHCLLLIMK